ncbi:polyprenol reductase 2 isoform X2 [Hevea brasiliensis]|uniref:polyprenol reductase 2 isoform X2 n=1 Tax=Hevea brasiliensis TaxID=3981 RepID=UPI0025D04AB0|nr:polyprenol reductase 2 isoform X2 [Hevea brasiliensis]
MEIGLVGLLRAAWIAGILPIVIASLPYSRLGLFHGLVLEFAKRGKIMQSSPYHKFTVPQRFFSHFYMMAVVWTTLLLLTTWIYAYRTASLVPEPYFYSSISSYLAGGSNIFPFHKLHLISSEHRCSIWLSVFLLLLMEVQVLRRLLETMYVFNYNPSARMHIFGYLTGLYFYVAAPLSLCCTCAPEMFKFGTNEITQFIVKGKDTMQAIEFDWYDFVNPLLKLGWCQWVGATIFFWGWIHQLRCHAILGSLREHGRGIDEYVIPYGDWFEIVSSPHYLAEIIIYAGMVVASGGADLTIWFLFAFVVLFLVHSGKSSICSGRNTQVVSS